MSTMQEHSPTLNTVIMVEEALRNQQESVIKISKLKKALPKQVNHNTLKVILRYLEKSNKIIFSLDGITWIFDPDPKLKKAIGRGMEL